MGNIRLGSKRPVTVAPGDSVAQAARAMSERRVGGAAVLVGDKIAGIITERDILSKVVAQDRDPAATKVSDVMTREIVSVGLKTSVDEAARLMREHHIRHLPVLDAKGQLVGILAARYVLYELMDEMERSVGDLIGYIMIDGPGG
jgi:CBS domain-containing protein